jgi:hypothetical protein
MAGNRFSVNSGEISSGTAAKTLLQVVAASNVPVKISRFHVSTKGTSSSASPLKCRVIRQSDAGTMSAATPKKLDPGRDETLQVTAQKNATAEPTPTDELFVFEVHPQGGGHTEQTRFGEEVIVPGGGRIAIEVTAAADVTVVADIHGEE